MGKHYNYFRDYDPSIGRYIESDPIGLEGGINTYGYVDAKPLIHSDPKGLRPGSSGALDPAYQWRPQPGDKYPGPAPDGACMVVCLAINLAIGHSFFSATGSTSSFMAGSSSAGIRRLGSWGGIASHAMGHTPWGVLIELGHGMHGCEVRCRKPEYCVPDWAKPYQNMPFPGPFPPFPR